MANLTLSIDDDLLKQSRLYAVQHDTSVNALVRAYLETLMSKAKDEEQAAHIKEIEEMNQFLDALAAKAQVPEGYRWNREEAYEGRLPGWNKE